jgi:hypothetical protein
LAGIDASNLLHFLFGLLVALAALSFYAALSAAAFSSFFCLQGALGTAGFFSLTSSST